MEQSNQSQRNRATRAGKEGLLVRVCGSVCGSGGGGGWWWSKKGFRKYRGRLHKIGG